MEKKKEFLWRYAEIIKRIRIVERRMEEYRVSAVLPGRRLDGMPCGKRKIDLSERMVRYFELEDKLKKLRKEASQVQEDILHATSLLENDQEKKVLQGRYVDLLEWVDIAKKMGITIKTAQNINGRGIKKLKILSQTYCGNS